MVENMANYIDGFVLPIPQKSLNQYRKAAEEVAKIWKEHGALAYFEYVGDDLNLEGTRSFTETIGANNDEVIIFGYVVFESKETRDQANADVFSDPRMVDLVGPLSEGSNAIFDAKRMAYGGFQSLIQSN
jgi:uncharacterized protein YbaA (DUF1428 family)